MEQGTNQILASLLLCNKEFLNFKLDESLKSIENEVVTLKNISNENVGIKIKTNAHKFYQVKPNWAILKPNEEIKIEIVAHLKMEKGANNFQHKFLIKAIAVNKEVSIKNLNSIFEIENYTGQKQDIKLLVKSSLMQSSIIEDKTKSDIFPLKSCEKMLQEYPRNQNTIYKSEIKNPSLLVQQSNIKVGESLNLSEQKPISEDKSFGSSNKKEDIELVSKYKKLIEDYKSLYSENQIYKEKLKKLESKEKDKSYASLIKFNKEKDKWSTRTLLILIFIFFFLGFITRSEFS